MPEAASEPTSRQEILFPQQSANLALTPLNDRTTLAAPIAALIFSQLTKTFVLTVGFAPAAIGSSRPSKDKRNNKKRASVSLSQDDPAANLSEPLIRGYREISQ